MEVQHTDLCLTARDYHGCSQISNDQGALPYLQPFPSRPFKRRRPHFSQSLTLISTPILLILLVLSSITSAASIAFQNCLSDATIHSHPLYLQWTPLHVDAKWNVNSPSQGLDLTIYGNVSGKTTKGPLPPPDSPKWQDDNYTVGKIVAITDQRNGPTYTTLYTSFDFLTYTTDSIPRSQFCKYVRQPGCPISPVFNASSSDLSALPAFEINHKFYTSYVFATVTPTVIVRSGASGAPVIACISAPITPDLGNTITDILRYIPLVVLVFVAVATVLAATGSPWGTTDPFKWTSNYGRDDDLLRLVTPGFGDCLQYIQFIVLSGALNLGYPGFFQPVVSQVSWAALMFKESFVSHGNGFNAVIDGIYATNGQYGLTHIRQLVGMTEDYDMWAGMVIWLLVILIFVTALCQIGFLLRWALRTVTKITAEDLRKKNWPFTFGNVVRIVCNFFLLPIVALSMFQLVIAAESPPVVVAFAVILIVALLAFGGWITRLLFTTKPRSILFDDLPILLLYGPLYNTYSDEAAPFALIPALLTFIRGLAIGAIQPSGIAQLVVLALCEVMFILTLHAFRPFHSPTSMNAYHTVFATVRLTVILLMVAFVPSLGVVEGTKGWVGYVILLLHGLLLIFGFFLNALQRIIEIVARLAGVGADKTTGAPTRVQKTFGVRQLSRRQRRDPEYRFSQHSASAMLDEDGDRKSTQYGGRSRSISASSAILLNSHRASEPRTSGHMDRSISGGTLGVMGGTPPTEASPYTVLPNGGPSTIPSKRPQLGLKPGEAVDPYYRPPRPRRQTGDFVTPGSKSRGSADWTNAAAPEDVGEQRDWSAQVLPHAAYLRQHGDSDPNLNDPRRSNVDYAVREVDYYYGVRGPALSSQPTRKLKTGPADPVGPVSNAQGWFKGLFGRKKRESGKGFEVVRSARAPPPGFDDDPSPKIPQEPYHDNPSGQLDAYLPGERTRSNTGDTETPDEDDSDAISSVGSGNESDDGDGARPVSDIPPALDPIEEVGAIDLPSRFGSNKSRKSGKNSRRSSRRRQMEAEVAQAVPLMPRGSFNQNQNNLVGGGEFSRLSPVMDEPESRQSQVISSRMPFSGQEDPRRPSLGAESALSFFEEAVREAGLDAETTASWNVSSPASASAPPTSYGHVVQHRASDQLRQSTMGQSSFSGSSAEVVSAASHISRDSRSTDR